MLNNKDLVNVLKNCFTESEAYFNEMENELRKDEMSFSKANVGICLGKLETNYKQIVYLLGIYDNITKITLTKDRNDGKDD